MSVGEITDLVCDRAIFILQRPQASLAASHFSRGTGEAMGQVENEDYVCALLRFEGGAAARWSRAEPQSASSARTASRSTATGGTRLGLPPDGRAAGLP